MTDVSLADKKILLSLLAITNPYHVKISFPRLKTIPREESENLHFFIKELISTFNVDSLFNSEGLVIWHSFLFRRPLETKLLSHPKEHWTHDSMPRK